MTCEKERKSTDCCTTPTAHFHAIRSENTLILRRILYE